MSDYKTLFGVLGLLIGLASYIPYYVDIFSGHTKPHSFSWFIWGLVSAIAFSAQTLSGGGIGAWATGLTALACFSIAFIGIFLGERRIARLDLICFFGAIFGLFLWRETNTPLFAVSIVAFVYALGFAPTFRKAYLRPYEETLSTFVLSLFKWGLGLLALSTFSFTTILFPAAIFTMNGAFVALLVLRRRAVAPFQNA